MAAAPPSIGAVTDALSIGPRPAAAAKNTCPQFEQNTAPAAIAAPHLEQYTVSPRLYSLSREPAKIAAKSYFQAATGSIHIAADPSRSLLPSHPFSFAAEWTVVTPQSFENRLSASASSTLARKHFTGLVPARLPLLLPTPSRYYLISIAFTRIARFFV